MRIVKTFLTLALVAGTALGSAWSSGAAYNKWHETELERWLSDHDIPYPTPADRKILEDLIKENWNAHVVEPYRGWDTKTLTSYLSQKGIQAKDYAQDTRDSLIERVKATWYETDDKAEGAWANTKDWILDTWTDSQLKAFCDRYGIPVPQPRKRDTLLQKIRENWESVAQKVGDTASYPGDWLYETWSESDLKEWLDTHGIPAPQPTTRDKLIATVRRNSRLAYLRAQEQAEASQKSVQDTYAALTDKLINAWSESQLKEFCDKNGINVPQGTKLNQLRALVRKHRAEILGDTVTDTAKSAFGAATSNIESAYAKATDTASQALQDAFDKAVAAWSSTRLKAYLDARGVPVPQGSSADQLRALVRKHSRLAASGWQAWTWDDLTTANLRAYLQSTGDSAAQKVASNSRATRDELLAAAQSAYSSASSAGGDTYASATSFLSRATQAVAGKAKDAASYAADSVTTATTDQFSGWSADELRSYLAGCGIKVGMDMREEDLRSLARQQHAFFKYGATIPAPPGGMYAWVKNSVLGTWEWVSNQLGWGMEKAEDAKETVKTKVHKEL